EQGITITKADIGTEPTDDRKVKKAVTSGSGKGKAELIVKEKEKRKRDATFVSNKDEVTKKQRTQKKRPVRKLVIHEEDDEEIDDEPLTCKRKRTEPEAKKMNVEADAGI
ncbi:hypothetical protein A2U01_0066005, partial [Trifolium medium]|nr:hypothetical protein [Trifolium medium]